MRKHRKSVRNRPVYVDYGYRTADYGYMYGDFSRYFVHSVSKQVLEVRYSCYYILLILLYFGQVMIIMIVPIATICLDS